MSQKLKIGVVGAGVFGGYHANKCAEHARTEFVGIFDPGLERTKIGADKHNVIAFDDYGKMLDAVEAVVIACPAISHGQMAITALEAGKHCLIEKPIAATLKDAERIVELTKEKKRIVQIGHQERFVAKAIGLDRISEVPLEIFSTRMAKRSKRGTDVSVTLDLMTHDLDLVIWLMKALPDRMHKETEVLYSGKIDKSFGQLCFGENRAELTASRVHEDFVREMHIKYPSGDINIDFIAKTLTHNTPFELNMNFGENPAAKDSLGAASNAFTEAVLDGTPIAVTAQDGYNALKLALIIDGEVEWENAE